MKLSSRMKSLCSYSALFFIFNISFAGRSFAEVPSWYTNGSSTMTSPSVGNREERTGRSSGWGLQNKKILEVDLSEWGGERPSCSIAPDCPVCIK